LETRDKPVVQSTSSLLPSDGSYGSDDASILEILGGNLSFAAFGMLRRHPMVAGDQMPRSQNFGASSCGGSSRGGGSGETGPLNLQPDFRRVQREGDEVGSHGSETCRYHFGAESGLHVGGQLLESNHFVGGNRECLKKGKKKKILYLVRYGLDLKKRGLVLQNYTMMMFK